MVYDVAKAEAYVGSHQNYAFRPRALYQPATGDPAMPQSTFKPSRMKTCRGDPAHFPVEIDGTTSDRDSWLA